MGFSVCIEEEVPRANAHDLGPCKLIEYAFAEGVLAARGAMSGVP